MNNIILKKAGKKEWYLTIENVAFELAVTGIELWALQKVINDNMEEIKADIEKEENEIK